MQQLDVFGEPKNVIKRTNNAASKRVRTALSAGYDASLDGSPYYRQIPLGQFGARNQQEHDLHVKAWRYGYWLASQKKPRPAGA